MLAMRVIPTSSEAELNACYRSHKGTCCKDNDSGVFTSKYSVFTSNDGGVFTSNLLLAEIKKLCNYWLSFVPDQSNATRCSIEIETDRGNTEAIFHCLKRVTFELADLPRRSQLSVIFGTNRLLHLVMLYILHSLLCRYYVLTVVFQLLLEKAGGWLPKQPVPEESQFQIRYAVFVRVLPLSL